MNRQPSLVEWHVMQLAAASTANRHQLNQQLNQQLSRVARHVEWHVALLAAAYMLS